MNICLYGSASDKIGQEYKDAVYKLGREIAERGHTLVFGGGANGLMGAVARGVKSAKGKVVGIIPKFFSEHNLEETFEHCDELVLCENMHERKNLLENRSDAFIIAPGGIGTYDEFFSVLTNKQLGRNQKPIALFNIFDYFDELEAMMYRAMTRRFIKANCRMLYMSFNDLDDMFSYLENLKLVGFTTKDLKDG